MGLRIAVITDCYLPYNSGVVHSIQTLNEEISSLGHEVFLFAPRYPNCAKEKKVFRFASLPSPTNPDYYLAIPFSRHLRTVLKKIKPHIIHVHHPFPMGWMGAQNARQLGLPLVYTCHTFYEHYSHYLPIPQNVAKLLIRKIYLNFCNRCDIVITPTAAAKNYLKRLGVVTPLKVIPTGINIEKFTIKEPGWLRKRYGIKAREKILLCVGRLGREKNIAFVLECFAAVSRDFPEARLVLVGKGPQERELKEMAKNLGLTEKVTFTGLLPQDEVIKCYHEADIFVFASVSETQGLVIPEAKSAGLPVVAVDANGVSEMVEEGVDGFLTPLSKEAFINKIRLLLQNENLRKKMAENARQNSKRLSSRNYALKLLEIYSSLIFNIKTGSL